MKSVNDSAILKIGRKTLINGSNSSLLKFDYVLCTECNNDKSKSMDNSFDDFSKKYVRELNRNIEFVDFVNTSEKNNVYRYLIKNFCCRLSLNQFNISRDLIEFVNGDSNYPKRVIVKVYSNFAKTNEVKEFLSNAGTDSDAAMFGSGSLIKTTCFDGTIDIVYSTLYYNNLVFEFFYSSVDFELNKYYSSSRLTLTQYSEPVSITDRIISVISNSA
jgi:hypothetical protein